MGWISFLTRIAHADSEESGEKALKEFKASDKKLASMLSSVEIVAPNITYSECGMNLTIGNTKFMFVHPEIGAHTLGDTVLCIPESGVMFLGDVLWNSFFPNVSEANIEAWIDYPERY